jgi:hypothetical protein
MTRQLSPADAPMVFMRVEKRQSRLAAACVVDKAHLPKCIHVGRTNRGPVLMTPLAFAFPASQWRECRVRPANVHGASFPQMDVGYLDAGLPSLTTERLRPCLVKRGIATLGDFLHTSVRLLGGVLAR